MLQVSINQNQNRRPPPPPRACPERLWNNASATSYFNFKTNANQISAYNIIANRLQTFITCFTVTDGNLQYNIPEINLVSEQGKVNAF